MLFPMKTLYIETATEKSCIALFDGEKWTYVPLPSGPELSKNLALEVSKLLTTNSITPDKVYVGKGPGSLTGVRVGRALAKALAFGWGVPLEEFCSLEVFVPEQEIFAVLVDARSGGIYVVTNSEEVDLLTPEKAKEKVENIPLLISPHPDRIKKRIARTCKEAVCTFARLDQNAAHEVR